MAKDKISEDEIRKYALEQDINMLQASIKNSLFEADIRIYKRQLKLRRTELRQVKKRIKKAKRHHSLVGKAFR